MTLLLPPPVDDRSPMRLVPVTPGASAASAVKLRLEIGRLCNRIGRDGERPLAALRLDGRRLAFDFDGLLQSADFEHQRRHDHAVGRAHGNAFALQGLEPGHRHFEGVRVGRDVRIDEVSADGSDDGRQFRPARLTDQSDGRAGQYAALRVFE